MVFQRDEGICLAHWVYTVRKFASISFCKCFLFQATTYNKLLTQNVTKTYKHAQQNCFEEIEKERQNIANMLNISNRVDPMSKTNAFISLKDHKPDFENNPKCRLINPAKSQLGKVSKAILDNINNDIRSQTQMNQWRNTDDAISWFKSIDDKHLKSFISFDIVDFYPSITEDLLDKTIEWAKQYTEISANDIKVIKHARKSLLFHNNMAWSKQISNNNFDVTMGSYDGAETCELVGLFILNSLQKLFGNNVGLYRDDGLAVLNTKSKRLGDKARKDLTRIFNNLGLKITAFANQQSTNFLDITFDLTNNSYKPYRKPNNEPLYINRSSNHPPNILRELPKSINKRINKLSCNKQTFDLAAPTYNDALRNSNFDTELQYEPQTNNINNSRRNRTRNILWYNPPFNKNVKTNIACNFLKLVDKHFPQNNKLHKLFNRHTVRVSYSCNENMRGFITRHNKTILEQNNKPPETSNQTRDCNCRRNTTCPIQGKCLQTNVVYKADVTTTDNNETKTYIGVTANKFKTRYRNHHKSINNSKYKNETELSKHLWQLKENGRSYTIRWGIISKFKTDANLGKCRLCLEEKLIILKGRKKLLNKRSDLFNACRHVTLYHK